MIEIPKDLSHGDLAIPVPKFNKFKKLTEKPNDVAAKWAAAFQPNELIEGANPTGPFINFRINKTLQTAKVRSLFLKETHNASDSLVITNQSNVMLSLSSEIRS